MFPNYKPYIPKSVRELIDLVGSAVLLSPTFEDKTGYFQGRNIDTEFLAIEEGLNNVKAKLGHDIYTELYSMSAQMRAYFEADLEDKTGDAIKGRNIALDMIDILKSGKSDEYWD